MKRNGNGRREKKMKMIGNEEKRKEGIGRED